VNRARYPVPQVRVRFLDANLGYHAASIRRTLKRDGRNVFMAGACNSSRNQESCKSSQSLRAEIKKIKTKGGHVRVFTKPRLASKDRTRTWGTRHQADQPRGELHCLNRGVVCPQTEDVFGTEYAALARAFLQLLIGLERVRLPAAPSSACKQLTARLEAAPFQT
jgi:hypothetical protein